MFFNSFIKQTEINSGGGIRISVYKQSFGPNGDLVAEQPHQIMIGPFDDFNTIIAENNRHLINMGYPEINPDELTLPLTLREAAHKHGRVQERMVIERQRIDEEMAEQKERERVATEQRAKDKEDAQELERANAIQAKKNFDDAVTDAVALALAKAAVVKGA